MIWLGVLLIAQSSTWYRLGYDALQQGDTARALRFFYRAVDINPQDRMAWAALLIYYETRGREDSVQAIIDRWAEKDPATALEYKGLHALRHDNLDEAWEAFHAVLQHDPRSYLAHLGISEILLERGKQDSALAYLQQRYRENPVPIMDAALGMLYAKMHRPDSALSHLEKHINRYKENPRFLEALVQAYLDAEQYDKALEVITWWEQKAPDERYWILLMKRDLGEARKDTTLMIQTNAELCEKLQSVQGCLQAANFLTDRGWKLDQAQQYVERVLSQPVSSEIRAVALSLLGDIQFKRGEASFENQQWKEAMDFYAQAVESYNRVLKEAPKSSLWRDYAQKQIQRAEVFRRRAYRKWKRIE